MAQGTNGGATGMSEQVNACSFANPRGDITIQDVGQDPPKSFLTPLLQRLLLDFLTNQFGLI